MNVCGQYSISHRQLQKQKQTNLWRIDTLCSSQETWSELFPTFFFNQCNYLDFPKETPKLKFRLRFFSFSRKSQSSRQHACAKLWACIHWHIQAHGLLQWRKKRRSCGTTYESHKSYKVLNGLSPFVSLLVLERLPFAHERKMTI